jgi:hypothetical protein
MKGKRRILSCGLFQWTVTDFPFNSFLFLQSPLEEESGKKLLTQESQEDSQAPSPPGGFIDLGKYASILSTLLAESVAKIAPKVTKSIHIRSITLRLEISNRRVPNPGAEAEFLGLRILI